MQILPCHKCKLSVPAHYLKPVFGKTVEGNTIRVKVCPSCFDKIKNRGAQNDKKN